MPRNFEIPDEMAEFLDEWAPKEQKLIERYRSQKRSLPPKGTVETYGTAKRK